MKRMAEFPESDRVMDEPAEYIEEGMDDTEHIDFVPQQILPIAMRVKEEAAPKENVVLVMPETDRVIDAQVQQNHISKSMIIQLWRHLPLLYIGFGNCLQK